tara:strand:- start:540 stop:1145 length:606 start_codon:yes stop_codon:yes gene_type:complete
MKTIVITGPSGSGKSYLSNKLSTLFYNSIVVKTDSYYRDNILIKFLSVFLYDIYDRPLSINKNEIKNTLRSINKRNRKISFYNYDFKRKHSSKITINIDYKSDNQFLILEGIFSHRIGINNNETINILCKDKKEICFKRRLKRDQYERGRNTREVKRKFNTSWNLFYKNIGSYLNSNKVIILDQEDKNSYEKLVLQLKKIK